MNFEGKYFWPYVVGLALSRVALSMAVPIGPVILEFIDWICFGMVALGVWKAWDQIAFFLGRDDDDEDDDEDDAA